LDREGLEKAPSCGDDMHEVARVLLWPGEMDGDGGHRGRGGSDTDRNDRKPFTLGSESCDVFIELIGFFKSVLKIFFVSNEYVKFVDIVVF